MENTKQVCPTCGKSFKSVNIHMARKHNRDMWKVIAPKEVNEGSRIEVFFYGEKIGEAHLSAIGDRYIDNIGFSYIEFYYGLPPQICSKINVRNVCGLLIEISEDDKHHQFHYDTTYDKKNGDVISGMEAVDKLNWRVERV